jgi:hypothetical protein
MASFCNKASSNFGGHTSFQTLILIDCYPQSDDLSCQKAMSYQTELERKNEELTRGNYHILRHDS